jgi:hypothetical protein
MSWAELSFSPAEHIPFDSGSEGLPVRGYGVTTVKSRAPPLDFTSPSIIDAFLFSFIETFEEASCDFRAVVLRQIEYLLKQRGGSVSHAGSLAQVIDTRGFLFGFIAEWRAIWHVRRTECRLISLKRRCRQRFLAHGSRESRMPAPRFKGKLQH